MLSFFLASFEFFPLTFDLLFFGVEGKYINCSFLAMTVFGAAYKLQGIWTFVQPS